LKQKSEKDQEIYDWVSIKADWEKYLPVQSDGEKSLSQKWNMQNNTLKKR